MNMTIVEVVRRTLDSRISDVLHIGPEKDPPEVRLSLYLKYESLMREFFSKLDFCDKYCFSKRVGYFRTRGDIGCCGRDYYTTHSDFILGREIDILDAGRIKKYGIPENHEMPMSNGRRPCRYHTPSGCILADHKGPLCIAYICPPFDDYLADEYDIDYDGDRVQRFFERILSGELKDGEGSRFDSEIKMLISIVSRQKVSCSEKTSSF